MLVLLFAGDQFIPEESDDFDKKFFTDPKNPYAKSGELWHVKYSSKDMKYVTQGFLRTIDGKTEKYSLVYDLYSVPSRHFTVIFNTFVMM